MKKKNSALPWVLAALLLVAILLVIGAGISKLSEVRFSRVWKGEAENFTLRPLTAEEMPEEINEEYEYYLAEFSFTNESRNPMHTDMFNVEPKEGERWCVRACSWEGNPAFPKRPMVPIGCTGKVRLPFRVDRNNMEGNTVVIVLDAYSEFAKVVAELELPK